jgi:hypothetical protein
MALLFMDGFNHYATGNILSKYTNSNAAIGAVGRNGNGMAFYGEDYSTTKGLSGAYPTIFIGFAIKISALQAWNNNSLLSFYEGVTKHIDMRMQEGDTGRLTITRNGTILGTTTDQILFVNEFAHIQIKIYIHDSAGTVDMLVNGVSVLSLTNQDTRNGGAAGIIDKIIFGGPKNTNMYISDLWIDDSEFLGDCKVETLFPSAAGDTTAWTPSAGDNYAAVDEAAPDSDTTYVSSLTADQVDSYTMGDLVTTAGVVKGVQVLAYARKDDAGSRNIAIVARPAATDRVGSTQVLGDSYTYLTQLWELNPEDSEAWEIADINGAKFGVKMVS